MTRPKATPAPTPPTMRLMALRVDQHTVDLLEALAAATTASKSAVIRIAVREYARRQLRGSGVRR